MDSGNTYENIDELLVRLFDGDVSKDEMYIIEKWKNETPENLKVYNDYLKIWETSTKARDVKVVDTEKAWKRFKSTVQQSDAGIESQGKLIHLFTGSFARIAAVAIILIGLASILYFYVLSDGMIQIYTEKGKTQTIELADGSLIYLNAETKLTYPDQLNGELRQVELNGEAYFEIARNENQAFVIKANGTYVKVLGTSFNVKANENAAKVEVNVNSGKVAFGEEGKEDPIVLEAGDKGIFSKSDKILIKSVTEDPNFFAWRTRKLYFNNAKLDYVVQVLNAAYYTNIKLANAQISSCTLTASFDNQNLDDVLAVIGLALDLNIHKNENEILLDGQGCVD